VNSGGASGAQVVIQQAAEAGVAFGRRVGGGQGPGVPVDEVMEPVAPVRGLGEQVLVIEGFQAASGGRDVSVVESGRGVSVDAAARVQAEAPEQLLFPCGQVAVGQVERGSD